MKAGSKYFPLYEYLRQNAADEITLKFDKLEAIIAAPLPASARRQRAWWSNRQAGAVQAGAWMEAGYHVAEVDLAAEQVVWRKANLVYVVRREGDLVLWDGLLVHALRTHMGLTQAEFAFELGVRQPTISEWETGAYLPKRSSSKLLSFIAERAGFEFEA